MEASTFSKGILVSIEYGLSNEKINFLGIIIDGKCSGDIVIEYSLVQSSNIEFDTHVDDNIIHVQGVVKKYHTMQNFVWDMEIN